MSSGHVENGIPSAFWPSLEKFWQSIFLWLWEFPFDVWFHMHYALTCLWQCCTPLTHKFKLNGLQHENDVSSHHQTNIAQLSLDVLVNNHLVRVSTLHANSNAWCCFAIIPRQLLLWDNFHSKLSIPEPSTIDNAYAFHVSPAARVIGFGFGVHEDFWWSRETANKKSLSINYFE